MKIINKIASGVVILSLLTYYASPVLAYVNEETIYSNLDSNGKAYSSKVTTIVEDKDGNKIEQNDLEKSLPIETKITYYLNGNEIEASKIAGASGRVTIKLEFENKDKHGDLYTPFVVVSGLILDNKKNSNIEVVNGKLLTNGNKTIAVGIALPGMQESLGINSDRIDLPSSVEVSMDTSKFESGNILVYASPKLLGNLDISMDKFDDIFDKVNALESATKALEDGAGQLSDGLKTLDEGANALSNQYGEFDNGLNDLKNGAVALSAGARGLDAGASSLVGGINQVGQGANDLAEGIGQVEAGANGLAAGLDDASQGAAGIVAGIEQVDGGINQMIQGIESKVDIETLEQQKAGLEAQIETYTAQLKAIPSDTELDMAVQYEQLTAEQAANYKQTKALLGGLVQSLQGNLNSLVSTESLYSGLNSLKNGIEKEDGLLAGANALSAGVGEIKTGANSLAVGISQVGEGATNLAAGAGQLSEGAESLKYGTSSLASGADELSEGAVKLKNGSSLVVDGLGKLADGSKQLVEGSETLANGIKQFNQEGISKISELINKGKNLVRKIERLQNLSNEYTSFASRESRDEIKFISITDGITAEKKEKNNKDE